MLTAAIERSDTGYPLHQLIWLLSHPLFWAALGLVIGPYLFYRGFRLFQRKRGPLWTLWALCTILGHSEIWGVLARGPK